MKAEVHSTLDITGFFFSMSTQVKAEVRSINIQYGQLLLGTSLPNFPITTLVKLLSSYIERTPKTSACNSGLYQRPVTDIRDRINNSIAGGIIVQKIGALAF